MRECIFCSSKASINREHLWPAWVIKSVIQNRSSAIERVIGRKAPITRVGDLKARCICKQCNEGWMSALENSAKPILEPMFHDSPSAIDSVQQRAIAVWTIKTAMVFECVKRDSAFYSTQDRCHLLNSSAPPPDTLIWIGRYVNSQSLFVENHYLSNPKPTSVLGEGCATTFAVGRLVIQSFTVRRSTNGEGKRIVVDIKNGQWDHLLIQVWPVLERVICWPPSLDFGPSVESLEKLAKRFGGRKK